MVFSMGGALVSSVVAVALMGMDTGLCALDISSAEPPSRGGVKGFGSSHTMVSACYFPVCRGDIETTALQG